MQAATGFHHPISKVVFPVAQLIFDHAIAFDPTNGMFHSDTNFGYLAIAFFFFGSQFFLVRLFFG